MMTRAWPALLLLLASSARAQIPTSEAAAAHMRFEEGVEHARRGDVALAMRAFEAAYAIRPHFSVLYNIAQAHSALGNPVEAIANFERYLAEGGPELVGARREAVERLLDVERKRVGAAVIHAESPRETRVWLDGRELAADRHDLPISLEVGDHSLLYSHGAGHPVALVFEVFPGQTRRQHIPAAPASPPSKVRVEARCDMPGVGFAVASTPLAPTPAQRQRDTKRRSQRRTLAIVFAGGSAASLVAAGTLYAWNRRRFEDLRSASRDTPAAATPGRVASMQRVDDAAIGLGALGLGLAIAATWNLLSDSPD